MSVGGRVIEVSREDALKDSLVYINTNDDKTDCAIYVKLDENSKQVKVDDIVWWQGNNAYWTTKDRKTHVEVILRRDGYSGVKRPIIKSDKIDCNPEIEKPILQ